MPGYTGSGSYVTGLILLLILSRPGYMHSSTLGSSRVLPGDTWPGTVLISQREYQFKLINLSTWNLNL